MFRSGRNPCDAEQNFILQGKSMNIYLITVCFQFSQAAVSQVVEKFQDIDPDVWCKILYMEYGKTVAKFYICDKEVVIDGSREEFTGHK